MKRKIIITAVLLYCFAVCLATAITGINGTWTGTVKVDGNNYTLNYTFKVDGDKLTGTSYQDQDDPKEINVGKVNGTDFTFSFSNKNGETFPQSGKYYAAGDSISLNIDNEGTKLHTTLKRVADK
jgi:hypothetical protein